MHIALFSDCYRPRINGVVTSLETLKIRLEQLGHQVSLIAPSYPNQDPHEAGLVRLCAFSFPTWPEDRVSLPWPPATLRRLFAADYDVIHIHTPFNLGVLGWWVARSLERPMVFTHHTRWEEYSHYLPLVSATRGRSIGVAICRYFFTRARAIVAPSDDIAHSLDGFQTKIRVVPTGIEPEMFQGGEAERVRRELGLDPQTPLFLYVGRLGKEKSIDFLFRCFRRVVQSEPRALLLLVGGGPEQPNLESMASHMDLRPQIRFLGYRGRDQLKHYLAAACLFLFASETETQGLVLLEAAAAGLPVLAIRASGVTEAVKEGQSGILCQSGDEEGFAGHMLHFARHPEERRRYHERAADWAAQFSAQASAEKMIGVYREVQG